MSKSGDESPPKLQPEEEESTSPPPALLAEEEKKDDVQEKEEEVEPQQKEEEEPNKDQPEETEDAKEEEENGKEEKQDEEGKEEASEEKAPEKRSPRLAAKGGGTSWREKSVEELDDEEENEVEDVTPKTTENIRKVGRPSLKSLGLAMKSSESPKIVNKKFKVIPMMREYPDEVKVFNRKFVETLHDAAETVLCKEDMPKSAYSTAVPPYAPKTFPSATFLIDTNALADKESLFIDSHGYWGCASSDTMYFNYKTASIAERILLPNQKTKRGSATPKVLPATAVSVQMLRYIHPNSRSKLGRLIKHIFVVRNGKRQMQRWAMVSYTWDKTQPYTYSTGAPFFPKVQHMPQKPPPSFKKKGSYGTVVEGPNIDFSRLQFPSAKPSRYTTLKPAKRPTVTRKPVSLTPFLSPSFKSTPRSGSSGVSTLKISPVKSMGVSSDAPDISEIFGSKMANTADFQEDFGDEVNLFEPKCIFEFSEAAEILLRADEIAREASRDVISTAVPVRAPQNMREASFLVDVNELKTFRQIFLDSHGNWGKPSGVCAYYASDPIDKTVSRIDHEGKLGEDQEDYWDFKLHKARYKHPNTNMELSKYIFSGRDREGGVLGWALVSYKWNCEPFLFPPSGKRRHRQAISINSPSRIHSVKPISPQNQGPSLPVHMPRKLEGSELERRIQFLKAAPLPKVYPLKNEDGEEDGCYEEEKNASLAQSVTIQESYPEGVEPFGFRYITNFMEAVDILLRTDSIEPVCSVVPPSAPMHNKEISFVVDLTKLDSADAIYSDSHGSYGGSHGQSVFFRVTEDEIERLNSPMDPGCNVKLMKTRYSHKNAGGMLQKAIFCCRSTKGKRYRYALVSYRWLEEPFSFKASTAAQSKIDKDGVSKPVEELIGQQELSKAAMIGKVVNTTATNPELQAIKNFILKNKGGLESSLSSDLNEGWDDGIEDVEINPEEEFPHSVEPFSSRFVSTFQEASDAIVRNEPNGAVCKTVPPYAPKKMRTICYVVDLQALSDPRDIYVDQHGVWGRTSGERAYYKYTSTGVERIDIHGKQKEGFPYDVKVRKLRCKHPGANGKLLKNVFVAENMEGEYLRWALITYKWICKPFNFEMKPAGKKVFVRSYHPGSHGHSRLRPILQHTPKRTQPIRSAYTVGSKWSVRRAATPAKFPRSIHTAAEYIFNNADFTIRQFPTKKSHFAVLDETGMEVQSLTVTKVGASDYVCPCEEHRNQGMCRHTLAVAKTQNEGKEYLDLVNSRIFGGGVVGEAQQVIEDGVVVHHESEDSAAVASLLGNSLKINSEEMEESVTIEVNIPAHSPDAFMDEEGPKGKRGIKRKPSPSWTTNTRTTRSSPKKRFGTDHEY